MDKSNVNRMSSAVVWGGLSTTRRDSARVGRPDAHEAAYVEALLDDLTKQADAEDLAAGRSLLVGAVLSAVLWALIIAALVWLA